jgi:hypothetical protein
MSRLIQVGAVLALVLATLALAACGGDDDGGGGDAISVNLSGDASQFGTATLTPEGEQTRVVIDIDSPVSNSQPAHIHEGTCDDLDPAPAHGLQNVDDGSSDTTVEATLEELQDEDYAINLHMSGTDLETYTSCGDIG